MITDGSHPSHMDPGPAQTLSSTALQSTTQQPWAPAFDLPSLTAVSPWLAGASIDLERMFDYGYGTAQAFLERALGPVSPARPLPPGRRRHLGHRGPQRRADGSSHHYEHHGEDAALDHVRDLLAAGDGWRELTA